MSKQVKILPDDVRSAASGLSQQAEALQGVLSDVKSAHGLLLLDDIFSLENYSHKVHLGLLKADGDLAKIKRKLEECAKKASSTADAMEQIDNGEGKVISSGGEKKSNNWLSWIGVLSPLARPFVLVPLVINMFNQKETDCTSSDAYVLTEWNGKETVEKKSDEFHQYYEELEAEHQQWEAEHARTEVIYGAYTDGVKQGQIRYVSQKSDLSNNGWGEYSSIAGGECGFASQSMAFSYIGKDVSPEWLCGCGASTHYGSTYGINGVKCVPGSGNSGGSEAVATMKSMLANFSTDGNKGNVSPVVIHYSGGGHQHAIVVVGSNDDGSYIALDPAQGNTTHNLNISDSGAVSGDIQWGSNGCQIDGVQQYMRAD